MQKSRTMSEVFDEEFLPIRAKLLEIAAALDRVNRAEDSLMPEARRAQVHAAIQMLLRPDDDRAERIQLLFSRPYDHDWREKFGLREQ